MLEQVDLLIKVCPTREVHRGAFQANENDNSASCNGWVVAKKISLILPELMEWPLEEEISCDLALDALLGTGIDREVRGQYRQAIAFLNDLTSNRIHQVDRSSRSLDLTHRDVIRAISGIKEVVRRKEPRLANILTAITKWTRKRTVSTQRTVERVLRL